MFIFKRRQGPSVKVIVTNSNFPRWTGGSSTAPAVTLYSFKTWPVARWFGSTYTGTTVIRCDNLEWPWKKPPGKAQEWSSAFSRGAGRLTLRIFRKIIDLTRVSKLTCYRNETRKQLGVPGRLPMTVSRGRWHWPMTRTAGGEGRERWERADMYRSFRV